MDSNPDVRRNDINVFWGEIAPCDHFVQIYEDTDIFLDTLEGFVGGGIRSGDGVIVIAMPANLRALEERLTVQGIDLDAARSQDQYISLDAEETLAKFIFKGWPDDDLFTHVVTDLITRARGNGRRVRAFGEMVAILWARGDQAATVRLEHLWQGMCDTKAFSLFCAYPKSGFTEDATESINLLCATHSKVVGGIA
jgi:hypothetical protein